MPVVISRPSEVGWHMWVIGWNVDCMVKDQVQP
jgi:hypothetical protein